MKKIFINFIAILLLISINCYADELVLSDIFIPSGGLISMSAVSITLGPNFTYGAGCNSKTYACDKITLKPGVTIGSGEPQHNGSVYLSTINRSCFTGEGGLLYIDVDFDNDGIQDEGYGLENIPSSVNILTQDSTDDHDSDGVSSYLEYQNGTNPFDPEDYPDIFEYYIKYKYDSLGRIQSVSFERY